MQWREWSGYFAAQRLRRLPRHRVQRDPRSGRPHRRSPLYKYERPRPRRAPARRPGHHPRRDEAQGRAVYYTPVVRRGRQGRRRRHDPPARRGRASAGRPPIPSTAGCTMNAAGLDVDDRGRQPRPTAAVALQGPCSRDVLERGDRASRSRTCATSAGGATSIGRRRTVEVESRTGYTGDLGYELWIPAERAGRRLGSR